MGRKLSYTSAGTPNCNFSPVLPLFISPDRFRSLFALRPDDPSPHDGPDLQVDDSRYSDHVRLMNLL